MTAKILEFPIKDEEHLSGDAICLHCKHEWQAVAPVGTFELECPSCSLIKGVYTNLVLRKDFHWVCHCGCMTFLVSVDNVYCSLCGLIQTFPD